MGAIMTFEELKNKVIDKLVSVHDINYETAQALTEYSENKNREIVRAMFHNFLKEQS